MYKLVAFDIDGTLLTSENKVADSTHQALQELKNASIEIIISSGRPYHGIQRIIRQIGPNFVNYASAFNGGQIYKTTTDEMIYAAALTRDEVNEICQFGLDEGVDIHTYGEEHLLTLQPPKAKYVGYEAQLVDMPYEVVDFRKLDRKFTKLMLTQDPKVIERVIDDIPSDFYNRYEIVRSTPFFLELTPKGVNKGAGLEHLSQIIGVNKDEVMTFGDQENDLSMIEWAGCGVAMGNAAPAVKESADFVTRSNDEDGILYAIDHLIFNKDN